MFGTWDKGVITGYFNVDLTQSVVIKASIMETDVPPDSHVGAKTVDSQVIQNLLLFSLIRNII